MAGFLANKWYIDELYDLLFVRPLAWLSRMTHRFLEVHIIDGIVEEVGELTLHVSQAIRFLQTGSIGFYLFGMVFGIVGLLLAFLLM